MKNTAEVNSENASVPVKILQKYGIGLNIPSNGVLPCNKNEFVMTEVMYSGGYLGNRFAKGDYALVLLRIIDYYKPYRKG